MLITRFQAPTGKVFYVCASCTYDEGNVVKQAGFKWHGAPTGKWLCNWPQYNRGERCPMCPIPTLQMKRYTDDKTLAAKFVEFADESARADLLAGREALIERKAAIEMSTAAAPLVHIDIPAPPGLEYLPFQKAGIAYLKGRNDALLADDMGLGKTIQALGLINADPGIRNVLVICPSALLYNWRSEALKWLVRKPSVKVIETLTDIPAPEDNFVIVNYEKFGYKEKSAPLVFALKNRDWDLIICDEAHRLKNPEAQRTKNIIGDLLPDERKGEKVTPGVVVRGKRKLFMSGTPFPNSPIELWPLLFACCPSMALLQPGMPLRQSFWKFAYKWCIVEKGSFGTRILGGRSASAMDQLQLELRAACMMRRLKGDVMRELPPKTRQIIILKGAEKAVRHEEDAWEDGGYDEELEPLQAEVELAAASGDEEAYALAVARLELKIKVAFEEMSAVRHEMALAKVPAVIEHVRDVFENLERDKKVIVFGHHQDVIELMRKAFEEDGLKPAVIVGGMSNALRENEKNRFQTDPTCRVILCSIKAAGEGLTLTAAQTVIFAELDWAPKSVHQAEDRAHRKGQTGNVLIQYLVVDGSFDVKLVKTMVRKLEMIDAGLDNPKAVTVPDLPTTPPRTADDEAGLEVRRKLDAEATVSRKYPAATDVERMSAKRAMQILAGICDGASTRDAAGFNRMDTIIGHKLANESRPFSDGQVALAKRLAWTYRRQLPADIVAALAPKKKREMDVDAPAGPAMDRPPF
jgi:SWI/SNF-related matrix-associated actin-dependent regulator 1 of chromatin subfamily A